MDELIWGAFADEIEKIAAPPAGGGQPTKFEKWKTFPGKKPSPEELSKRLLGGLPEGLPPEAAKKPAPPAPKPAAPEPTPTPETKPARPGILQRLFGKGKPKEPAPDVGEAAWQKALKQVRAKKVAEQEAAAAKAKAEAAPPKGPGLMTRIKERVAKSRPAQWLAAESPKGEAREAAKGLLASAAESRPAKAVTGAGRWFLRGLKGAVVGPPPAGSERFGTLEVTPAGAAPQTWMQRHFPKGIPRAAWEKGREAVSGWKAKREAAKRAAEGEAKKAGKGVKGGAALRVAAPPRPLGEYESLHEFFRTKEGKQLTKQWERQQQRG